MRVLLLGGTTEASALAMALKGNGIEAIFSYAGRTNVPMAQPVETRVGGFGGIAGLKNYLRDARISHVVDATHPFAATMGWNAHSACAGCNVPLLRLERPAWRAKTADRWIHVPTIAAACDALPNIPARVFLAIGRMHVDQFAACPDHHYLLRLVDPPVAAIDLPDHTVVLARGPFDVAGDIALMQAHNITHIVAKNAGGSGAVAKIEAARKLGLQVIMIDRPHRPKTEKAAEIDTVLHWLHHSAERGV
ncbi:cobalt-precorrin-6A reductase [Sulfitobacter guttiformis]|uniref:Precorrin-6A/cobalt-precorrin-6A reductase n=1 Tax=Sulfitobacter guttiformis TaxID=74349 RepID=A0A420DSQ7_9RHOB|nr:cobalt-precorrin-6A reductase [Sulfitobacter guttiformis]KIN74616.1 Precorrin-6x reductase [Sulfitobacter guttiformis KCTC 32187]RKE97193.1 precorrin-6A/cobalt-precorrin-6A reductase [Sulfitobacter guttiformis]